MSDQFFSGKWEGYYVYGNTFPEGIKDTSTPFKLDITVVDGNLKGICEDVVEDQQSIDFSTITGFIENNYASFIKEYPCLIQFDKNLNRVAFPEFPSPQIQYSGLFENGKFSGRWEINIPFEDHEGNMIVIMHNGTWEMVKSN